MTESQKSSSRKLSTSDKSTPNKPSSSRRSSDSKPSARESESKEKLHTAARQRAKKQSLKEKIRKIAKGQTKAPYREIVINIDPLETRVATLSDGILESLQVEQIDQKRTVGSIFKGKIQNLENGLQAAFIDIGQDKNAFLHYWDIIPGSQKDQSIEIVRNSNKKVAKLASKDIPKQFSIGTEIVVQITKDQISSKGSGITTNLSLPGRFLVLTPFTGDCGISRKIEDSKERTRLKKVLQKIKIPQNVGVIIQTAGEGQKVGAFEADFEMLLSRWKTVQKNIESSPAPTIVYEEPGILERTIRDSLTDNIDRILVDSSQEHVKMVEMVKKIDPSSEKKIIYFAEDIPIFERFSIERQATQAFGRVVPMPSGGELVIEETEALVAIDVNTGSHKQSKDSGKDYLLQVNLEAAKEVARQIQLRNIGGLIIIDFIDMKSYKDRQQVIDCIKDHMEEDKAKSQVLPISKLGIMQMTRQRHTESYTRGIYKKCPYCSGSGNVKSPRAISVEIQRQIISVASRINHPKDAEPFELEILLHPDNLQRLIAEDERYLIHLEKHYNLHLSFITDSNFHIETFRIIDKANNKKLF